MITQEQIERIRNFRQELDHKEASTEWGEGWIEGTNSALDAVLQILEEETGDETITPVILEHYDDDAALVEFDFNDDIAEQYSQGGLWQVMQYMEEHYVMTEFQRQVLIHAVTEREKENHRAFRAMVASAQQSRQAHQRARSNHAEFMRSLPSPIDLTGGSVYTDAELVAALQPRR